MKPSDSDASVEINFTLPLTTVVLFLLKTAIVCVALVVTVRLITPSLPQIEDTPKNRLILIGLVNNPYVLEKLSMLQEEAGNLEKSLMLAEAALALQKLHNPNERTYLVYEERVKSLIKKNNFEIQKP